MQQGHVQKLAEWTKQYGDVFRLSLGEREAVSNLEICFDRIFGEALFSAMCR